MKVNWLTKLKQHPIIFNRQAKWSGIQLFHRKALAGEMSEIAQPDHGLNVTLAGSIKTEKITETGDKISVCRESGNICLVPSKQPHVAKWGDNFECLTIQMEPSYLENIAIENDLSPNFELIAQHKDQDLLIPQIGLALVNESSSEESVDRLYSESLLQTLTMHILKNYSTASSALKRLKGGLSGYKLRLVTEYINDNLDKDLSLTELAHVSDLSRFHFSRTFRQTTGMTPHKYLMKQRVEKAKLLLEESDIPLVEVGLQTGFKNQRHFTSLFRKFTNLTPKLWRDMRHA